MVTAESGLRKICKSSRNTALLGAILALALPGFPQEIQWIRSFSEGMKLARDSHRPALVDFWSEWCIPCKQMDREVYTDPGLIDSFSRFVLIRVDVDSDPATARRFGIKILPMRLFLDPGESILREIKGFAKASDILATMNSIPEISVSEEDSAASQDVPDTASPQAAQPGRKVEMVPGALPNSILVAGKEYTPPATIVDLSIPELLQKYPQELTGIEFDSNQQELDFLLRKVGERVKEFSENLPNTVSKEQIRQEKLRSDGSVSAHLDQNVQYLLLLSITKGGIHWEESRTDEKGKPAKLKRLGGPSLLTSGFALECLLLSPEYQSASKFRYLGRQSSEPYAHLIAFAQRPEIGALPTELRMKTGTVTLLGQGLAWVDPRTFQIMRMRTDILEPQPKIGLKGDTTEIYYDEHRFGTKAMSFWMPREVTVTLRFSGIAFRNTHRYSDYKLFTVESFEKRELPPHSGIIK